MAAALRRRRRTMLWGTGLLVVLVAVGVAVTANWPSGGTPTKPAAAVVQPGTLFHDSSLANARYTIAATAGEITDGGLVLSTAAGQDATLTSVEVLDAGKPAALRLVDARVNTFGAKDRRVVGVRSGPPTSLADAAGFAPLHNKALTHTTDRRYELVLGLRTPSGAGPWHVSAITVTYLDGGQPRTQTFGHDLTVCAAAQTPCTPVGTAAIHTSASGSACAGRTTSWASGPPTRAWLATDLSSDWQGSGGTISWSTSRSASYSISASVGFAFTASDVFTSVKVSYGVTFTHQFSTSSTWSYQLTLPPNSPTERATVYVYAWVQPVTTETTKAQHGTCTNSYAYGTVYAPDKDTDPHRDYCIALEPYPGRPDLGATCHSGAS